MKKAAPPRRAGPIAWIALVVGIVLIGFAQLLSLQTTGLDTGAPQPPLATLVADAVVLPLLRFGGDADPAPDRVAQWLRYTSFAIMAIGVAATLFGAHRLFVARRR